jgi:transcriptional antiterminator NusG
MSGKRWYVVHAYSGFEKSVQRTLLDRIQRTGMQDKFGQVLVPVEEVVEMKAGQKTISERKFFPGYVLVQMDMTEDTWHLVKETPKVLGFIGGTPEKPAPITERLSREIRAVLADPATRARLEELGGAPPDTTPESYTAFIRDELASFAPLVRAAGLTPQ